MRWLFLAVIIILFELLTYGVWRGLAWWGRDLLSLKTIDWLKWTLFAIGNGLLVLAMVRLGSGWLKVSMTWLTLLWLFIMAMAVVGLLNWGMTHLFSQLSIKIGFAQWGVRVLLPLLWVGLIGLSVYNAYTPVVRHVTVHTNQPLAKPIRLGMVSDLHLGVLVGNRQLTKLTELVKTQGVELLLMAGDVMDDNTDYYESEKMQPALQQLAKAVPMGIYASLGNHDMYGHESAIREAIKQADITLLADSGVLVDERFWLIGRLDNHASHRKDTKDLLPQVIDKPIILLDHEPNGIDENVQLPIDLQLSGHTHNGQMFPANFIVQAINRLGYGHERINDTDVIVSSGYGFWGVPLRLGSQAEIWVIDLVGQ
ncbi:MULTISPECIES: metallophosphoesterase [unclassified Moraxella]|uniref:metallophosphoesterase n=1 Tax=unclassified Moraxella TaxID=2685852 RepID=UPI003AF4BE78